MSISVDDLTKNEIEGTGVFDELMRSVKAHLEEERVKGSITPVNYSSVYLGALQSTMAQSVDFLLNKDKSAVSAELVEEQKINLRKEALLLDQKKTLGDVEIANAHFQAKLLQAQLDKAEEEILSIRQDRANALIQGVLLNQQVEKTKTEVALYEQKTRTEEAQIRDKVDGVTVAGVTGIQKTMYKNQADGYIRLAEQQYARLMLDGFAVLQSNAGLDNFAGNITEWGVTPPHVLDAVIKLKSGVS